MSLFILCLITSLAADKAPFSVKVLNLKASMYSWILTSPLEEIPKLSSLEETIT